MEKGVFAIYDQDPEFVFRFMEFIKKRPGMMMDVRAFTSEENLRQTVVKTKIDLLLVSSSVLSDSVRAMETDHLVILLEDSNIQTDGLPGVYKYQSPDELLRKIMEVSRNETKTDEVPIKRDGMQIIGIYSPVGRTRKTSFALTMGQVLARNRAVLYLNLETFAGFEQLFDEKYERNLSDLLYFIRQKQTDLQGKLRGITRSIQNLDFVPPVLCPEDLQSVPSEEWMELFRKIQEQTNYEVLILDLGEGVQNLTSLLAACDKIFVSVRSDPMSQAKLKQFFLVLEAEQGKEIAGKSREVKIPFCQNGKTGKAFFEDLVWSEMGDVVRKELLEEAQA